MISPFLSLIRNREVEEKIPCFVLHDQKPIVLDIHFLVEIAIYLDSKFWRGLWAPGAGVIL